MKNAVAAPPTGKATSARAPKNACSPWPTASSPPTQTSAPTSSGAWACPPKRSAPSRPASTWSCSTRDRAEVSRRDRHLPDERVVLFVGRIDPIKGIDTLIEAAEIMLSRRSMSPSRIHPRGRTSRRNGAPVGPLADVAESIERRGIAASFRLVGSQPQDQLPVFYAAADVVAVPSRYESFGLVAVEALACGKPVVASRVGGLRFTIDEGTTGFLVKPQSPQALARALEGYLRRRNAACRDDAGCGPALGRAL